MNNNIFKEELLKLNIKLTDYQLEQLEEYYKLLVEWNEKINLTAIIEKESVYLKHFYDSLTLSKIINLNEDLSVCDIGTGAGFPGIVLKIAFPNLKITLVDALNKRINFLNLVIEKLNLKDIKAVHGRMEEYAINHVEEYDIITARAVSHLSNLLEFGASACKIGGHLVFMKSDIEEEIKESSNAIKLLNLEIEKIESFNLPIEESKRTIISIKKIDKTPNKYPRKFSEIKKNRL